MIHFAKRILVTAAVLAMVWTGRLATASEPPADLCSLLPAAEISKILGQTYGSPQKTEAPRPFANTATGTDCNYQSKQGGGKLWFRAYVDPSPAVAADLFSRLSKFYGTPTPVPGLGDEAYFDREHALHVRKGKVRFYLNLNPIGNPPKEKQLGDLASRVVAQL